MYPENGCLPFNERGLKRAAHSNFGGLGFDGPEHRHGVERCIEAWASPPMRALMYQLYNGIVQTADAIGIFSKEAAPQRIICPNGKRRLDSIRTFEGHSIGHWEGVTLVVETTHFSDVNPERATTARPTLISSQAVVTERFTRLSETELNYQYEVNDPFYYTEPFRGEFSFNRDEIGHIIEYACHEGNYSISGGLMGARVQTADAAAN